MRPKLKPLRRLLKGRLIQLTRGASGNLAGSIVGNLATDLFRRWNGVSLNGILHRRRFELSKRNARETFNGSSCRRVLARRCTASLRCAGARNAWNASRRTCTRRAPLRQRRHLSRDDRSGGARRRHGCRQCGTPRRILHRRSYHHRGKARGVSRHCHLGPPSRYRRNTKSRIARL